MCFQGSDVDPALHDPDADVKDGNCVAIQVLLAQALLACISTE